MDASGHTYLTGQTFSANFPTTPGAFDTNVDERDAFVVKVAASGAALVYSTVLGGSSSERGNGIAVDAAGNAYIIGETFSQDFPTTPGAFDETGNATPDVFVTKLNPSGAAPVYSTYLGGSAGDRGNAIAVDGAGHAHLTGAINSLDFPVTPDALDTTPNGDYDAFVATLDAAGAALLYSTYLGGQREDSAAGIAIDGVGNAYVTGRTESRNFPTTADAFDTSHNGGADVFVIKVAFTTGIAQPR